VIVAVVVVLAVLGTVLAVTLWGGDDGSQSDSKGAPKTTASSAAAAAGSGGKSSSGSATANATGGSDGQSTANSSPVADAAASSDGDGAVKTYKGGQGYSIGLPAGWKYQSSDSAGDRFTGPDGQKLLVAWTSTPKDDPVADWRNQEQYMVRPQYHRIAIEKADYRGWNTADWEFTYVDGSTTYRVIDRGFVVDSHLGYGLMYTAKADDWDGELRKNTWKTLTQTFQPKS
jgi:hypothetical protein